ncbi:MAG: peptidoglycan editing factor PgeF [Acidobacteria bacterium]|nr:peptidoglycan editing factor PgeF [Acidobacteriota bacterium]
MVRKVSPKQPPRRRTSVPTVLHAPLLADIPWLVHAFSTRAGGVSSFVNSQFAHELNLGNVAWDSTRNVDENRRRFRVALGAADLRLVVLRQIHSDLIRHVDSEIPTTGDALITDKAGYLLSIIAADCLPILIADSKQRVIAAVHCGWRGTARRLAEKVVGRMRMFFNSQPQHLRAAIGPGIRRCCYRIGSDVEEEFRSQFTYASKVLTSRSDPPSPLREKYPRLFITYKSPEFKTFHEPDEETRQIYLDLVLANVTQLVDAGLPRNQIYSEAPCTSCHPELFFSHRRDAGRTGRMMGSIGIKNK